MARHTKGTPLQIDCNVSKTVTKADGSEEKVSDFPKQWKQHEFVLLRTLVTQGDREWINARSMQASFNPEDPEHPKMSMDVNASMSATVARMVLRWNLMIDKEDALGNPIYGADGEVEQEPLLLPDSLEARLAVVRRLHEDDITFIYQKLQEGMPKPRSAEEKNAPVTSSTALTSTN